MMKLLILFAALASLGSAVPVARSPTPTVVISSPQATIVGLGGSVEEFPGVPFAQPPVGPLRLKPPQAITKPMGRYAATKNQAACPQFFFSTEIDDAIPTSVLGKIMDTPLFQTVANINEDCLYLNIHRPAGIDSSAKLPVIFWIFGGGFELGWNFMYDGSIWVRESIRQRKPVIFVTVNYRVGGFGFMPGAEILKDGSANLGLLDQRLGLKWIADNIEAFGGDPEKVTLWGESAGAISIFDQMAMYEGDNTYNGKPLFRGAIMNSGSLIPADPVDCPKGQAVYDTVVDNAGCSSASDTLECLRGLDYKTFLDAANSVAGILSYSAVALSYLPRPDGTALTESPELLAQQGKYAKIPFIIGDQEDEGTLFALFESNITNTEEMVSYFTEKYFHSATTDQIEELIGTYQTITEDGSPFRTGILNNWYPEFKRLAAILGDFAFILTRRVFLDTANTVNPDVPTWSYLSSYDWGTPIMGTFHGSDILQVFYGVFPNYASLAFRTYYLSFVNSLDPNEGNNLSEWPQWSESNKLLNMYPLHSQLITDDFRSDSYQFLVDNAQDFRI